MWKYDVEVDWTEDKKGEMRCAGKPSVEVATPPEFGGPENIWTPEDLLTGSVATCIMTSTLFFTNRAGIEMHSYKSRAEGVLEKTRTGLAMTAITVEVSVVLKDAAQEDELRKAVDMAEKSCPLSKSLNCPVELKLNVSAL